MPTSQIALEPLTPLPPFASDPSAWTPLGERFATRPFFFSEGMSGTPSVPRRAAPWLVEASRELVLRFDRFYRAVANAKGVDAEPARAIGEPYDTIARAEGDRPPLPLSRFDCVLDQKGVLRVIELNPIGVCTLHLRACTYLAIQLERAGYRDAAAAINEVSALKVASILRYANATLAAPPRTIGIPHLPNMYRCSRLFWIHELTKAGLEVVQGHPDEIVVSPDGVSLRGRPIDILWNDWFAYFGYQQRRYEQTRFATRAGDFSQANVTTERLLRAPDLPALIASKRVTVLSPLRGYRALSKALLAWIDRPELDLSEDDRAYLREHTAQTYDHHARLAGRITPETARADREQLVLKPCRFGGAHGVALGRETPPDAWARQLEEVWADPEWALQVYHDPILDTDGAWLSFGIYNYSGELGGMLVRSAPQLVVGARTARLIATSIGA